MDRKLFIGGVVVLLVLMCGLLVWVLSFFSQKTFNLVNIISSTPQTNSNHHHHHHSQGSQTSADVMRIVTANRDQRQLALDHRYGIGRDVDMQEAERILMELHEQGDVIASAHLFSQISMGLEQYSRNEEADEIWGCALEDLYELFDDENLEAGFAVAYAFRGVEEDKDWILHMERMTRRSLEAQYIPGILLRAELLMSGEYLEQNKEESVRLYQMCADMGCVAATTKIGNIYMSEEYPGYDPEKGKQLLLEAAAKGDPQAWYKLAYRTWGEEMNADQSAKVEHYLRMAWDAGELGGAIRLVDLLLHDSGPEPDLVEIRRVLEEIEPELSHAGDDNSFRGMMEEYFAELEALEEQQAK